MLKSSKMVYLIGSIIIGLLSVLVVYFSLIGAGVVNVVERRLVLCSATAEKTYDGLPLENAEYTISDGSLATGHSLNVVITGKQTQSGSSNNFITATVVDENGFDCTDSYKIEYQYGTLKVNPRKLVLVSPGSTKAYDGEPLKAEGYEIAEETSVAENQTLDVTVKGEQTEIGSCFNEMTAVIKDAAGEDVTSNYDIEYRAGTLAVLKRSIVIETASETFRYNGEPQGKIDGYVISGDEFLSGTDSVSVDESSFKQFTDVGEYENVCTATVTTENPDAYEISYKLGTIKITKRPIEIATNGATKSYDGTPLKNEEYYDDGSLVEGHNVSCKVTGSQEKIGSSENTFIDVKITDADGKDVTANYDVTKKCGTLEVFGKEITITTPSGGGTYNGTPYSNPIIANKETVENLLAESGHYLEANNDFPSLTNPGSVDNSCTVDIVDENGVSVKDYYKITYNYGTITVTQRTLKIEISQTKVTYNGQEQTGGTEYRIIDASALAEKDELSFSMTAAKGTNAGTYKATYTYEVTDKNSQENVTSNYEFIVTDGGLVIEPKVISIAAASFSYAFDGNAHTVAEKEGESEFVIADDNKEFLEELGHSIVVSVNNGTRTEFGSQQYTIGDPSVNDANGDNVTSNYDIKINDTGCLNITGGPSANPSNDVYLILKSDRKETFYLKINAEDTYSGRGAYWTNDVTDNQVFTYEGQTYSADYLVSLLLKGKRTVLNAQIESKCGLLCLPYYLAIDNNNTYASQTSNNGFVLGDSDNPYIFYYIPFDYLTEKDLLSGLSYSGELAQYEAEYKTFVYQNYLALSDSDKLFLENLIDEKGLNKEDINEVVTYIRNAINYNDNENAAYADTIDNVLEYFLSGDKKDGVCRHYATCGTLLFRALGIPARYAVGFLAESKAGEETEIKADRLHAWVEIYIDGVGWVQVDVTGGIAGEGGGEGENPSGGGNQGGGESGSQGGNQGGNQNENNKNDENDENENLGEITLMLKPVYIKYDGESHSASDYYNNNSGVMFYGSDYQKLLDAGFTITAEIYSNSITFGKTEMYMLSYQLSKNGIPIESPYEITCNSGVLQVYQYEITVKTGTQEKTYDGSVLSADKESVTISGTYPSNYHVECTMGSRTDAGSSASIVSVTVYDENGVDVTDYIKINKQGMLTIKAKEITVTAGSKEVTKTSVEEMSIPLTYSYATISGLEISDVNLAAETKDAQGYLVYSNYEYVVKIKIDGECYIGETQNTVSEVIITDKLGKDVTKNFAIKSVNGTLKVNFNDVSGS